MIKDYIDVTKMTLLCGCPKFVGFSDGDGDKYEGIPKSQIIEVLIKNKPPELRNKQFPYLEIIRESGSY